MKYRHEIDGLRALALLPVIFFHAGFSCFSGGFVGVDVFFVISGYLIASIILHECDCKTFSIVNFYKRRAKRILPALFFMMLICVPFAWLLLLPNDMRDFSQSIISVPLFISNILFWKQSGYFETVAEFKPLIHTWSLAVEEQYYLFFPLFLTVSLKFSKRWSLALLAVFFLSSFVMAEWLSQTHTRAAFFLLPTRVWEMLIGVFVAIYLASPFRKELNRPAADFFGWFGLLMIFFSVFSYSKATPSPSFYTIIPTLGAAFIIVFSTQSTTSAKFLSNKIFVGIGLLSYSAYLWHQPLFAFARVYTFNQLSLLLKAQLILITFFLAFLSYKYIETPFRKSKTKYSALSLSYVGVIFFCLFGLYGVYKDGFPDRFANHIFSVTKAVGDWTHPGNLEKTDISGFYVLKKDRPIDILFFGDSHVEQYSSLISEIFRDGENVGFLTAGGCPPVPNLLQDLHQNCKDLFDNLDHILKTENFLHTILIGGCFNCYFIRESSAVREFGDVNNFYYAKGTKKMYFRDGDGQSEALDSFGDFVKGLSLKYKLVVIGDNPLDEFFDPTVIASHQLKGESNYFKTRYQNFPPNEIIYPDAIEVELNQKIKLKLTQNIKFINSIEVVCPSGKCDLLDEQGNPIYKDSNHMRPGFVKSRFERIFINLLK